MTAYSKVHEFRNSKSFAWYLFCMLGSSIVIAMAIIWPSTSLISLFFMIIFLTVYLKPMVGVYLLTLLYPIQSICFQLNLRWPWPIKIYVVEILDIILLMVLILKYLSNYHLWDSNRCYKKPYHDVWIFYFFALFVVWSAFTLLWCNYFEKGLFSWAQFNSNFVTIAFLITYLDSYDKFIRLMAFYCCVAAVFALMAICATYHAFLVEPVLLVNSKLSILGQVGLRNEGAKFIPQIVGMRTGLGLCSKHELVILLSSSVLFSVYLIKHYKSSLIRTLLVILILLYETIFYQAFSRVAMAGTFFATGFICLAVPFLRKWTFIVMTSLIGLNLIGYCCSEIIKPAHMKSMESTMERVKAVSSKSEFKQSSYAQRVRIWRETIERIQRSKGMGNGPGSLFEDSTFFPPHGHNIVLTLAAEYGIPGAAIIILTLFFIAKRAYNSVFVKPRGESNLWLLQVVFVAAVLCALFEYSFDLFVYYQHLWYVIGLLLASLKVKLADSPNDQLSFYTPKSLVSPKRNKLFIESRATSQ